MSTHSCSIVWYDPGDHLPRAWPSRDSSPRERWRNRVPPIESEHEPRCSVARCRRLSRAARIRLLCPAESVGCGDRCLSATSRLQSARYHIGGVRFFARQTGRRSFTRRNALAHQRNCCCNVVASECRFLERVRRRTRRHFNECKALHRVRSGWIVDRRQLAEQRRAALRRKISRRSHPRGA